MNLAKKQALKAKHIIFIWFGSLIWCALVVIIAGGVITGLERPMQGENVILPWQICIGTTLIFQVIPLILASIFVPKTRKGKVILTVSVLTVFFIVNFVLGGIGALDKAWRKGW